MKIAMAQMEVFSGKPSENTQRMETTIANAAQRGVDVVVFPEMTDTGYDMPTILKNASDWSSGPAQRLRSAADKHNINVIAGISEKDSSGVYNAIIVIDRNGDVVGRYRKTHLITAAPMHEEKFLGFGEELVICLLDGVKIGLMTCYEIRFPEIARRLAFSGAEILVIPAAFPLVRLPHWEILTRARAIENQVFVAAISRVGSDFSDSLQFCGTSTVYDPYGAVLASSSQIHESLVTANLDLNQIKVVREQIKLHQDVREDLYAQEVRVYP